MSKKKQRKSRFNTKFLKIKETDHKIVISKAVRSGGAGGAVAPPPPPPEIFEAKKKKKITQILYFQIVLSV